MFRQWLTLVIIVLVYIPVAIDATVLHVAAPAPSEETKKASYTDSWF